MDPKESSDLWLPQGILTHTTAVHWVVSRFGSLSVTPGDACASVKIPVDRQFVKHSDQLA